MPTAALSHTPVYPVLLPILSCLIMLLFGSLDRKHFVLYIRQFLVLTSILSLAVACYLEYLTIDGTVLSYHVGGWIPPYGIEVRIDAFSALALLVINFSNLVAVLFTTANYREEIANHDPAIFWSLWYLVLAGLSGMVTTGDLFNLYVFLEISSLATYVLVAGGKTRFALSAAFNYLMIGSFGAAFFFTGLIFLYMLTGTLNMTDLATVLKHVPPDRTFIAAFCFILLGLAVKSALFPVHLWLPNVYAFAPVSFTIFLIGVSTKVSLYALVRVASILTSVIQVEINTAVYFLTLALLASSFFACVQHNYLQILAYSSIAQLSLIVLGFVLNNQVTLLAGASLFFIHALTKVTLLIALLLMAPTDRPRTLHSLRGTAKRTPYAAAVFLLAALSLIGFPATPGFTAKWMLLQGSAAYADAGWVAITGIIVSSALALLYLGRIAWQMFLPQPVVKTGKASCYANNYSYFILGGLTLIIICLSLYPKLFLTPFGSALELFFAQGGSP